MSGASGSPGLYLALKNAAATLLGMAQTRLELVGVELRLEKIRLLRQLALALGAIISAAFGVMLIVALTTLFFWEQRIVVVAAFAVLFVALTLWFYTALKRSLLAAEPVFTGTLSELQNDVAQLKKVVNSTAGTS